MPLITRSISPLDLCLHRLPPSVQQDELQCVSNGTLANLIRQLSSLSRNAESIFSEIHREVLKIDHRTNTLFLRVDRLGQKLMQSQSNNNLKGVMDQVSLEEAAMCKAFKSCNIIDQHSLDRQTLPQSLLEQYQSCDAPPQLNQLNPYREDEKEALRYYTDPSYFFELWRNEMLKECGGGMLEKKRAGRSSTSPSHLRRRQQDQQQLSYLQHLPQSQQNALFTYHVSSRSSDYSRFASQSQGKMNYKGGPGRTGHFPAAATEVLHFPAEYQSPQSLLTSGMVQHQHIPPPVGMSMIGGISESLEGQPSNERMNLHVQQQSHVHHPQLDVLQNKTEDNRLIQQGQELCLAVQTSVDAAISGGGGVAFLDDEDDELPPPPPQNILSSALLATNPPICVPTPSSSSLTGSSTNSATLPATEEAFSCSGLDKNYNATSTQADEQVPQANTPSIYSVPPPPPPPPPPQLATSSANVVNSERSKTFGNQNGDQKNPQHKPSSSATQDQRSLLMVQIQQGVKLKRVQQQEELKEKRAVATSNDVAAILAKRMEHCLGNPDSSSEGSSSPDDNEWDD